MSVQNSVKFPPHSLLAAYLNKAKKKVVMKAGINIYRNFQNSQSHIKLRSLESPSINQFFKKKSIHPEVDMSDKIESQTDEAGIIPDGGDDSAIQAIDDVFKNDIGIMKNSQESLLHGRLSPVSTVEDRSVVKDSIIINKVKMSNDLHMIDINVTAKVNKNKNDVSKLKKNDKNVNINNNPTKVKVINGMSISGKNVTQVKSNRSINNSMNDNKNANIKNSKNKISKKKAVKRSLQNPENPKSKKSKFKR